MRYFTVIVLIACLMALCNANIVALWNQNKGQDLTIENTACVKVDAAFSASYNYVWTNRYHASFFANDDCTYLVGLAYPGNPNWQRIPRQIRSVSVVKAS
ncbi:hypothetical protein IW146_004451 [Coemansia sp. RSA 922]|nr:hypothetical protein H4S03_002166 [Coemansia sp. S3946]KAJ2067948.1 hypothetical protein GGI08_001127 [Coemansia sp. S2]KAJ2071607.1 hypothetical protein GGH13_003244 [Coemansia sp. S155-1]KAJ2112655.1 hypothetical protein IW146_004451 [Coemansia sp. RSA 922]KAJ2352218.1 hypothetical protein GGH92_001385 [Coemansia sp. RSA 2673]